MIGTNNTSWWEAHKLSFSTVNQTEEWKTLDIDVDAPNQTMKGQKQMKMLFTGGDRQALQTLVDNGTIIPQIQETPKLILNTIQRTIRQTNTSGTTIMN